MARKASLDYIIANGAVITDAVSSQVWPGDAVVHVSIVNWVKNPKKSMDGALLNKRPVSGITSRLTEGSEVRTAVPLASNKGLGFEGCKPAGDGFILTTDEAAVLLSQLDASYADVVKPYLVSRDIANNPEQSPSRYIIDFGLMDLEDAMAYPAALAIVREKVKPVRDTNNREAYRKYWWRFSEARPGMRAAIAPLSRYASVGRHGKRLIFVWSELGWCPSDATNVIARDDDWTLGVLSSEIHDAWAWEQSSTIKADLRYTPKTALWTFPFPEAQNSEQDKIEQAARDVVEERSAACQKLVAQGKKQAGLTAAYNAMDEGAFSVLRSAHQRLDEAVCRSYGWPLSVLRDREEIVNRLYGLNASIAADPGNYNPFGNES